MKLHVLNPGTKRRRKRTTKKRSSKTRATKKRATKPKRSRKATRSMPAKRRKRSRKRSTRRAAPRKRSSSRRRTTTRRRRRSTARRRSNPSGFLTTAQHEVSLFAPRLGGKLLAAAVAQQVGRMGLGSGSFLSNLFGVMTASPTAGQSWNWAQYLAVSVVTHYGMPMLRKFMGAVPVREMQRGAWDLLLTKLVWTQGIARVPMAQALFGSNDGMLMYDSLGQGYVGQGGNWAALQGMPVTASPLDGEIVEASALDGLPVTASPLDGSDPVTNAYYAAYGPAY